jgi:uncharacterized protein YbjQ (UPF0145 family)
MEKGKRKTLEQYAADCAAEAHRGERLHGQWRGGPHQGGGVIKEEYDELWDEIRADNLDRMRLEALQLGAMAIRFLKESEGWEVKRKRR